MDIKVHKINDVAKATSVADEIDILDLANLGLAKLKHGQVSPEATHAAYQYITTATELVLVIRVTSILTSGINKSSLNASGQNFDAHTSLLAQLGNRPVLTMMLVTDKLRISDSSTHVPRRAMKTPARFPDFTHALALWNFS